MYTKEKLHVSSENKPAEFNEHTNGLGELCTVRWASSCLLSPGWEGGTSASPVKMCSLRKQNRNGWKHVKSNQIKKKETHTDNTCCEEAKLTVLGTSYAIWVDTPPMSRIPAVLLRRMASLLSLPGMFTSTTASSSAGNETHLWGRNKSRELGSLEVSSCF